jgi:hypothetical protein
MPSIDILGEQTFIRRYERIYVYIDLIEWPVQFVIGGQESDRSVWA